jgi:hypothetical protein
MTRKPPVLCGHIPSTGAYSVWFWDQPARTYWPEIPFAQAIEDPRFKTYVADAIGKRPELRTRNEKLAIEIAMQFGGNQ